MQVNLAAATIDDIKQLLNDTGYVTTDKELSFARDNDLFKFVGVKNGHAVYLVGFEDEDENEGMYVSKVFVSISKTGTLEAEWAGMPCFESKLLPAIIGFIALDHTV